MTRKGRDLIDLGFWVTGTDLPALADRGHAHLVVDETVAEALGPRLDRFESDLVGDGWQVSRLLAPRGGTGGPGGPGGDVASAKATFAAIRKSRAVRS